MVQNCVLQHIKKLTRNFHGFKAILFLNDHNINELKQAYLISDHFQIIIFKNYFLTITPEKLIKNLMLQCESCYSIYITLLKLAHHDNELSNKLSSV